MKLIKLTAVSAAILASSAAMAADQVIVVDNNAMGYNNVPAYQYDSGAGIIRNTTGAFIGTTKTIFNTLTNPAAVSIEAGSLGYGANVGFSVNDKVELQAGWAGGDVADLFGGDFDVEDLEYDVDSDFSNPYLGVQLRPAGNWFTMGAGVIVPDNDIDINANAKNGQYEIDNVKYDANEVGTLKGNVEHRNDLAPYLTIGFRPNINNKFGVYGEVGAAYLGDVNSSVRASGGTNAAKANAAAAAANRELEGEDYLEWLPIVKLGATYRF